MLMNSRLCCIDENVLNGFLSKVRNPEISKGDLRTQIAATHLGGCRSLELVDIYGIDQMLAMFEEIISYGDPG